MSDRVNINGKSTAARERRHGVFWVGLIILLLGGQILMLSCMVYLATSDPSFAVEPDYYRKGLNWDDTAAQMHENRRLGWSVRISIGKDATPLGDRSVTCRLTDNGGLPIEGALVDLVAFPHSRGNQRVATALPEVGRGEYAGALRFQRTGVWEFRLAVQRENDTLTFLEQRNVLPAKPASR